METEKKQKRVRRQFTDEFKAGVVKLVLEEGKPAADVALNRRAPVSDRPLAGVGPC